MKKPIYLFVVIISLFFWGQINAEESRYLQLVDSVDFYIDRELWEKAESTIIKALKEEPANFSNALLFSNLGIVRINLNDFQGAREAFDLGLSISPGSTTLLNNRSRLYLMSGDYEKAYDDLNQSFYIDPEQEWVMKMLALLNLRAGETEAAKQYYGLLNTRYPDNIEAYEGLGKIAESGNDFDKAVEYYRQAIKLKDNTDTRSFLIMALIQSDKYSEASLAIRESISLYPDYGDFYAYRGYLHYLNYRLEEAMADKKFAQAKGADSKLIEQLLNIEGR